MCCWDILTGLKLRISNDLWLCGRNSYNSTISLPSPVTLVRARLDRNSYNSTNSLSPLATVVRTRLCRNSCKLGLVSVRKSFHFPNPPLFYFHLFWLLGILQFLLFFFSLLIFSCLHNLSLSVSSLLSSFISLPCSHFLRWPEVAQQQPSPFTA